MFHVTFYPYHLCIQFNAPLMKNSLMLMRLACINKVLCMYVCVIDVCVYVCMFVTHGCQFSSVPWLFLGMQSSKMPPISHYLKLSTFFLTNSQVSHIALTWIRVASPFKYAS